MKIEPHGSIVHEKYRVKEVDEVKCWTILRLGGGASVLLKRLFTNRDLVENITGEEIEISRIEHPPLPNSKILDVSYRGMSFYPVNPSKSYEDI